MIHIVVFNLFLIGVVGVAMTIGGPPERMAAALMVVANVATALLPYDRATFSALDWGGFSVDLVLLAAFVWIALTANRFWPIWLAALQLLAVSIHVVRAVDGSLLPLVYAWSIGQIAYPMVALVAIGAWRHRRRRARWGSDPAWCRHERGTAAGPVGGA